MTRLVVLSPHLDDAVLSVGQLLAGHPNAVVITVFGGMGEDPRLLTDYDQRSGFVSAAEASAARRAEDRRACSQLDVDVVHLRAADHAYRTAGGLHPDPLAARDHSDLDPVTAGALLEQDLEQLDKLLRLVAMAVYAERARDDDGELQVVGPLGLSHPDHLITSGIAVACGARHLYEEAPYRTLDPDGAYSRRIDLELKGWRLSTVPAFIGTGDLHLKAAALGHYRSQLWALNVNACLVPERIWQVLEEPV